MAHCTIVVVTSLGLIIGLSRTTKLFLATIITHTMTGQTRADDCPKTLGYDYVEMRNVDCVHAKPYVNFSKKGHNNSQTTFFFILSNLFKLCSHKL